MKKLPIYAILCLAVGGCLTKSDVVGQEVGIISEEPEEPQRTPLYPPAVRQVVSPQKLQNILASIPQTEDGIWQDVLRSTDTLFYTEAEMPSAYQMNTGPRMFFAGSNYNLSGDGQGPHFESSKPHGRGGNANIEFPWKSPGGTDESGLTASTSVKFVKLPRAENGVFWPVVYQYGPATNRLSDIFSAMYWYFPVETVFGEILYLQGPGNKLYCFEIRLRIRRPDFWDVEVLRPFPTYDEFRESLAKIDQVAYTTHPKTIMLEYGSLEDFRHPRRGFRSAAMRYKLPPLPPQTVEKLLAEPFKPAAGIPWITTRDGNAACYSPTASEFSVVPVNYQGTFLGTNHFSCRNCHESTMRSARFFDQGRGWYGLVRGSADGIFSFLPVTPSSVSYNGGYTPHAIRPSFAQDGVVAHFNPQIHTAKHYTTLPVDYKRPQE
jgi:hypothetical protein